MRKDQIGSVALRARAAIKEALGKVTGDERLRAEGAAEKAAHLRPAHGRIGSGQRTRTPK